MARYTPATLPENLKHRSTNRLTYTPSIAGTDARYKYGIKWWGKDAFFQHPAILISAYNGLKYWNFREEFEIPKDMLFFADSGGFQNFSQGVWEDPIKILRWMELNANIGTMFDLPPSYETSSILNEDFKRHAKLSKRNYLKMDKNRKNYDMKLYKPIHGNTLETLKWWFKFVEDVPCEGYGSSPRRPSAMMAAFTLSFAIEYDLHEFHLFLGSGVNVIPTIVYASRFIQELSFDSSSFSLTGARYRKYVVPLYPNEYIDFGRDFTVKIEELPCTCPVCKVISDPKELQAKTAEAAGLILLHNLHQVITNIEMLNRLVKDVEKYKSVIKKNFPEETLLSLKYLDSVVENGLEDAYSEFSQYMDTGKMQKRKNKDLGGFY